MISKYKGHCSNCGSSWNVGENIEKSNGKWCTRLLCNVPNTAQQTIVSENSIDNAMKEVYGSVKKLEELLRSAK